VVEGTAKGLTVVKIAKDRVTFMAAKGLKGLGNYETINKLKAEHGKGLLSSV